MIDTALVMKITVWTAVAVAVMVGIWKRESVESRAIAVTIILAVGSFSYMGVQTSSRLAMLKFPPSTEDQCRGSWEDGAFQTRLIAQDFLPIGAACALALTVLSLLPHKKEARGASRSASTKGQSGTSKRDDVGR